MAEQKLVLNLVIKDDGSVTGTASDSGEGPDPGPTPGVVEWVPSGGDQYRKTGRAVKGQMYTYAGAGFPGNKTQLAIATQPNYNMCIGFTEGLEAGCSMSHSPMLVTPGDEAWRIYFQCNQGGPDSYTDMMLDITPTPM